MIVQWFIGKTFSIDILLIYCNSLLYLSIANENKINLYNKKYKKTVSIVLFYERFNE